MSSGSDGSGSGQAWSELDDSWYKVLWDRFESRFGFRAGMDPSDWPATTDPTPSVTFDLSGIPDGPMRATAFDTINAEALRAFVWSLPDAPELVVLDWQHPCHVFRPAVQALMTEPKWWDISVYPNGDYYAFLTPDFNHGTFGHPWEKTLCVMGDRLLASLGKSLSTWLPVKRVQN